MIAGFIQVDAFMEAVSVLKENCCLNDSSGRNGKTVLFSIWSELTCDLETRINEQDDKLAMFIKMAQNTLTEFSNNLSTFISNLSLVMIIVGQTFKLVSKK